MKYPTYPAYKDSGVDWLGDVPEHWEVRRLSTEVEILTGFPFESKNFSECGVRLARGINVKEGILNWKDSAFWPTITPELEKFKLMVGDVLIGMDGSKVGKNYCKIESCDLPLLLVQRVARLRTNSDSSYIFCLISNWSFLDWVNRSKTDPMVPHISSKDIGNYRVPLPPLHEQKAIATFLDEKTAQIDRAVAQNERLMDLLRERQQIVVQTAVTRGLDQDVEMKDSGVDWIGDVPKHWEVVKLKRIARTESGGTPPSGQRKRYYGGHIPWVRTTDLNNDILVDTPEKITKEALRDTACKVVPRGTVCVAMYGGAGTIGKHSFLDFSGSLNQAVCGIISGKRLIPNFLFQFIKFYRPHWMIGAKGSRKDPNIGQDLINNTDFPLPPLSEQAAIVAHIKSQATKTEKAISLLQQQNERLKEYKAVLIDRAVTGKINITDHVSPISE